MEQIQAVAPRPDKTMYTPGEYPSPQEASYTAHALWSRDLR